jgi:hypothetical protein
MEIEIGCGIGNPSNPSKPTCLLGHVQRAFGRRGKDDPVPKNSMYKPNTRVHEKVIRVMADLVLAEPDGEDYRCNEPTTTTDSSMTVAGWNDDHTAEAREDMWSRTIKKLGYTEDA